MYSGLNCVLCMQAVHYCLTSAIFRNSIKAETNGSTSRLHEHIASGQRRRSALTKASGYVQRRPSPVYQSAATSPEHHRCQCWCYWNPRCHGYAEHRAPPDHEHEMARPVGKRSRRALHSAEETWALW
jgi:hypothetical protein